MGKRSYHHGPWSYREHAHHQRESLLCLIRVLIVLECVAGVFQLVLLTL